jgi:hypothetical protein
MEKNEEKGIRIGEHGENGENVNMENVFARMEIRFIEYMSDGPLAAGATKLWEIQTTKS